ncbi:hypothetical protein EV175_003159 [Coemansia sp. RSA 1933]|nr:hypothetical protein EV175_003159 [Coemansia sp. RSA 1933]
MPPIPLGRRFLATGFVHINSLPEHITSTTEIISIAQQHSIVYSIWTGQTPLTASESLRRVSVRLVTERIPSTIDEISELPDPTEDEIKKLKTQLVAITDAIQRQLKAPCIPIAGDPGMFQRSARKARGLGPDTSRFDVKTTNTPQYSRGLIDGYRKGFKHAKWQMIKKDIFKAAKESDDELYYLSSYLTSIYNRNRIP